MYPTMVGLLVGGIMGTPPTLAALACILWSCCVVIERHEATSRTIRTEAGSSGVKPEIHEALIDDRNAARCDGGRALIWKETQVSQFAHWWFR